MHAPVKPLIYILDDDESVHWLYQDLLQDLGAEFRTYASAPRFLADYRPYPCECLITDLRMPELSGVDVQRQLLAQGAALPIIFVSGHPVTRIAVDAVRSGALHFLEKPVDGDLLAETVRTALAGSRQSHAERVAAATRQARLALLTDKEKQVAERVVAGFSSREIAAQLGLSSRTVENHRAHLMQKLHAESVVDLVKLFK